MTRVAAPGHRADLDGLRGIAILLVFAVHSLPHTVPGGFVGVDVFFVLSGYLIAEGSLKATRQGQFVVVDFYASRLRRLGPALALLLLVCGLVAATLLLPRDAMALGQHIVGGAAFVSNLVLWREAGYFDSSSELKPLLHLWSLGVEVQFYLLWPLFAIAFLRWPRWRDAIVAAVLLSSFALNVSWVDSKPKGTFFLPPTRIWELLVGVQLSCWLQGPGPASVWRWLHRRWPSAQQQLPTLLSWGGLGLLVLALLLIDETQHFPGWWALMPTAGAALVIGAGPAAWPNRVPMTHPVLRFYGDISYPLYLWHWPLLTWPRLMGWPLDVTGHAAVLLMAVLLATLTTYGLERPARQGAWRPQAAGHSAAALALAALGGLLLWQSEGWPQRYPPAQSEIAAVHVRTDYAAYRVGSCFLRSAQGAQDFAPECRLPARAGQAAWVLWGDSHAASLWPGLEAEAQAHRLRVTQWTSAACPPGWNAAMADNANCAGVNRQVLADIEVLRPHTVVLAARWATETAEAGSGGRSRARVLRDTVQRLQRAGVEQVIVVGPLPQWAVEPPRLALHAWRETGAMPEVAAGVVDPDVVLQDDALRREAEVAGARFVSPLLVLCASPGCRLLVPGAAGPQVLAFDQSHLTAAGSRWLVPRLALWPSPAVPPPTPEPRRGPTRG